ncbi:hypothetical protein JL720_7290 [Aureococcus anophagefferens]|nr:hypothetical protein JL720_7290 [Aureococcus anophagefferens]
MPIPNPKYRVPPPAAPVPVENPLPPAVAAPPPPALPPPGAAAGGDEASESPSPSPRKRLLELAAATEPAPPAGRSFGARGGASSGGARGGAPSGNRISGIVRSAKAEDRDLAVKIRKELAEFDKDGDGTIDNEELVKFIKKHADAEKKLAKERHDAELESAKQQHEAELELHRRKKAERNVVRVVAGSFFLRGATLECENPYLSVQGNGTGGNGSAAALTTKGGAVLATASSDFAVGERGAMVSKADGAPLTTKSADLRTDAGVLETPGGAAVVAVAGGAAMARRPPTRSSRARTRPGSPRRRRRRRRAAAASAPPAPRGARAAGPSSREDIVDGNHNTGVQMGTQQYLLNGDSQTLENTKEIFLKLPDDAACVALGQIGTSVKTVIISGRAGPVKLRFRYGQDDPVDALSRDDWPEINCPSSPCPSPGLVAAADMANSDTDDSMEATLDLLMGKMATATAELRDIVELRRRLGMDRGDCEYAAWRQRLRGALDARPTSSWRRKLTRRTSPAALEPRARGGARRFGAAARLRRRGDRPAGSYCKLLYDYASCACVVLLVPAGAAGGAAADARVVASPVSCGSLRALRFRDQPRALDGGLALKHAPRKALPHPVTTHNRWWSLRRVDGAFTRDRGHLLELLGAKPDAHLVRAEFALDFHAYTLEVPIARRSLDAVFAKARAVVPAWADGAAALKLSRLDRPSDAPGLKVHYRASEAPFAFNLFLSKPRLGACKYRLIASEDSEDDSDTDASDSEGSSDSSDGAGEDD